MKQKLNKTGLALWGIFLLGIIGSIIGLYNAYIFSLTDIASLDPAWIMLNPEFLSIYWPMLVGNPLAFGAGIYIFVFRYGSIIEEEYSEEEVQKIKSLMESKGFTFKEAEKNISS